MKNIKIITSNQTIKKLTPQEKAAGENVIKNCLGVKPKEKILIVTDYLKEKQEAAIFFETAKKLSLKVKMIVFPPTGGHGQEPPSEVIKFLSNSDVVLAPTTYSLTHTHARHQACQKGARFASMPGITKETILRTLIADYSQIAPFTQKIAHLLTQAQTASLFSPSGTNIVFYLKKRKGIADTGILHQPGEFGNLPAGEAFIAPQEGKTKGIVVFEACFGEEKLASPLAIEVKKGLLNKILCPSPTATKLEKILNKIGPKARNIAELGIGTNPLASPKGGILELEKIYGTVHIALGNNAFFGGEVDVPYHIDGLIVKPTLFLDGKPILKDGKFILED